MFLSHVHHIRTISIVGIVSAITNEMLTLTGRFEPVLWLVAIFALAANVAYCAEQIHFLYFFKLVTSTLILLQIEHVDELLNDNLYSVGVVAFGIFFVHGYLLGGWKLRTARVSASGLRSANLLSNTSCPWGGYGHLHRTSV